MMIPFDICEKRRDVVDELSKLYRTRYGAQWRWTTKHLYSVEYAWIVETIERYVGSVRGKNMIDAGGGASALSAYLAVRGANIAVVDHQPKPFDVVPPIPAIKADLTSLPPNIKQLDAVVSCSAIEHNDWVSILRIVRGLLLCLKPGGVLIATVPADRIRKFYDTGAWPAPFKAYPKCYLFDHNALRELAGTVADFATLETPTLDGKSYSRTVEALYAEMLSTKGMNPTPYLSMGMVFRRSS